jgi:hypothetical protein
MKSERMCTEAVVSLLQAAILVFAQKDLKNQEKTVRIFGILPEIRIKPLLNTSHMLYRPSQSSCQYMRHFIWKSSRKRAPRNRASSWRILLKGFLEYSLFL